MKKLSIILIALIMTTNILAKTKTHRQKRIKQNQTTLTEKKQIKTQNKKQEHKKIKKQKKIQENKTKKKHSKKMPKYSKNYFDSIYSNINGYKITDEDREFVNKFGSAVYGEINYNSLKTILDELKPKKSDVFYDLGSGIGKTVVQASLDYKFKKCVGIELSSTRHEKAEAIRKKLNSDKKITQYHEVYFKNQDIAQARLKNATIIFMCSTCFPDKLMKDLIQKFALLKKGTKILTLKGLEIHRKLKFIKQYDLPMSWSNSSPVYLYEVV
jgi:hypothetical protein